MFAFSKYKLKNLNIPLILVVAALCILGYMVLNSAVVNDADGPGTLKWQLTGFIAGGCVMLFLTLADYHFWMRLHWLIYAFMIGILGLCFTPLRIFKNGAYRWVRIPGLGSSFQPSEFAKVCMILFFAWFFDKLKDKLNKFSMLAMTLALFGIPALMIFEEPDLSTTLTFTCIFLSLLFVAGISYRWIGIMGLSLIPVAGLLVWDSMQENPLILKQYMLNRLLSHLNPDEYSSTGLVDQQDRAAMAIASGKLRGKGLFTASFDSVKNGNFLSEENWDFVFAVVGEELGFVGSAAVITLFAILVFLCFRTASRARDMAGRLIAVGAGTFVGLQVFINIGVTSGLLPNTGVVLPFFSAGLSSLICVFAAMGLVMNVSLQRSEMGNDW